MPLKCDKFAEPVRRILGNRQHVLPLTRTAACDEEGVAALQSSAAAVLFPGARASDAALSGLLLLLGCWDESHEISQKIPSPEGSYWHAIAHRIEPDAANSAYWFRRVGEHPIFPELHRAAAEILRNSHMADWRLTPVWDPFLFIDWCGEARQAPGTRKEHTALEIQRAEWELLLMWCASEPGPA